MKKITQNDKLKGYLCIHKTITPMVARQVLRIERLAARIYELRKAGMKITRTRMVDYEGRTFFVYKWEGYDAV